MHHDLWRSGLLLVGLGLLAGCMPVVAEAPPVVEPSQREDVPLVLVCVDPSGAKIFADGEPIPPRYTEDGPNFSPPLTWTAGPAETKQWALTCEDLDAHGQPWVHWVIYKLPADLRHLFEGIPANMPDLWEPVGALQGRNSWPEHNIGYYGPHPPIGDGPHRYRFTLYALDEPLDLPPGVTQTRLLAAMQGHILATATLTGTFERPLGWRDPYDFSTPRPAPTEDELQTDSDEALGPGPPEPDEPEPPDAAPPR